MRNSLSSLSEPTSGEVVVNGVNPYKLKDGKLAKFRRQDIAIIFQNYNLVPALPVLENVIAYGHLYVKTWSVQNNIITGSYLS